MTTCKFCGKEIRYILGKGCSPIACDPEKAWFEEKENWTRFIDCNRNTCCGIKLDRRKPGAKLGRSVHMETCEALRKNREKERLKVS